MCYVHNQCYDISCATLYYILMLFIIHISCLKHHVKFKVLTIVAMKTALFLCHAVQSDISLLTFQRILLPP